MAKLLGAILGLSLVSCIVTVPELDEGVFACTTNDDCVEGYECVNTRCRLVGSPSGDTRTPPGGDTNTPPGDTNLPPGDLAGGDINPPSGDLVPPGDVQMPGDSNMGDTRGGDTAFDPCGMCVPPNVCVFTDSSQTTITCLPPSTSCADPTRETPVTIRGPAGDENACVECNGGNACMAPKTCQVIGQVGINYNHLAHADAETDCECTEVSGGWYSLGGSGCADGLSRTVSDDAMPFPSIAITDSGEPVVAYTVALPAMNSRAHVRQFKKSTLVWGAPGTASGDTLNRVGGNSASEPIEPDVSFGGSTPQALHVAWSEQDAAATRQIYTARMGISGWEALGDVPDGTGIGANDSNGASASGAPSVLPSLALDANNKHLLVWSEQGMGLERMHDIEGMHPDEWRRWEANGDMDPGPGIFEGSILGRPRAAWSNGVAYVAYDVNSGGGKIRIETRNNFAMPSMSGWGQCDSCSWSPAAHTGQGLFGGMPTISDALMVDIAGGGASGPVVAFRGRATGGTMANQIYVSRLTGDSWEGIGNMVDEWDQLTATGVMQDVAQPSIELDASDLPFVAWEQHNMAPPEIYLLRRNAGNWEQLGMSGTAGGISATPDPSETPAVAIGPSYRTSGVSMVCVAWLERQMPDQIYMRCRDY